MADYLQLTPCLRCRRLTANLKGECVRCLGRAKVTSADVSKILGGERVGDRTTRQVKCAHAREQRAGGGVRILRSHGGSSGMSE